MDYVLRASSDLSIKQGIITPEKLGEIAKEKSVKAIAITDFMNMFGFLRFYKSCNSNGIKPILGVELLIIHPVIGEYKILAYAKSNVGLKNLFVILSLAYTKYCQESETKTPHLPHGFINDNSIKDIIFTNGGIDGYFGVCIRSAKSELINEIYEEYKIGCGKNYYLEINRFSTNSIYSKEIINKYNSIVIKLYKDDFAKFIFTNPTLFNDISDYDTHLVRVAASCNTPLNSDYFSATVKDHYSPNMHFLSKEEYELLNSDIINVESEFSKELVNGINVKVETGKNYLPIFKIPTEQTEEEYFKHLSQIGLDKRLKQNNIPTEKLQNYQDRLDFEIGVISKMGFIGYFLIVQDFINWAKDNGIPVGPGRGSGAGSIVAYSLGITDLDPLPYDLLFERFLNPDRVSMPDFDIDFCQERRGEVILYVQQKYGKEAVSQIMTTGTMASKAVIKDVARALGKPLGLANSMANKVDPKLPSLIDSYNDINQTNNGLMELVRGDDEAAQIWEHSIKLEGLTKSVGKHAAGVLIAPEKITDFCPLYQMDDVPVSQLDKNDVEAVGLVKFDFLGLRNLTIINNTLKMIKLSKGIDLVFNEDFTDFETYKLLQSGNTAAIFQLESSGMQKYLIQLKPNCLEDIIAMLALYRPGPLGSGMVDTFVKRKNWERDGSPNKQTFLSELFDSELSRNDSLKEEDRKSWCQANSMEFDKLYEITNYFTPALEECLKPTYGVIVYQEQVMKISQIIAGYTLGGADLLRRCISGDSNILLGNGELVKLQDMYFNKNNYISQKIISFNETNKINEVDTISNIYYNGQILTYKVKTKLGREIKVTKEHLLYTESGWKMLKELSVGRFIYTHSECIILDEIISIEEYKFEDVYDLEINSNHNFYANDILVHNCMGKKKPEEMAQQRGVFRDGAIKNGYDESFAMHIFDLMESFAEYGFNKSHSAAYAVITYQTAYLKAHYPAEFMAATLQSENEDTEKLELLVRDCHRNKIKIVPPNINLSKEYFSVNESGEIVYGLVGLKRISNSSIKAILEERDLYGEFKSFDDFIQRNFFSINKALLESLTLSGAFDCFDNSINRGVYYNAIPEIMNQKKKLSAKNKRAELFFSDDLIKEFKISNEFYDPKYFLDKWELAKQERVFVGYELTNSVFEALYKKIDENKKIFDNFKNSKTGEIVAYSPTSLYEYVSNQKASNGSPKDAPELLIAGELSRTPNFEDDYIKITIRDSIETFICNLDPVFDKNWFKKAKEMLLEGRVVYFVARVSWRLKPDKTGCRINKIIITKFIDLVKN